MSRVLYFLHSKAHFPAHRSTIEALQARRAKVRLYFDDRWSRAGRELTAPLETWVQGNPDAAVGQSPTRHDSWRGPLALARSLRSYQSLCRREPGAEPYAERWLQSLRISPARARQLAGPLARGLAASPLAGLAADLVERTAPPSDELRDWLQRKAPSIVVIGPGNSPSGGEIEIAKAALSLRVKTVVAVETWDALSRKGLIGVQPDLLLVWNEDQKRQAQALHRIGEDRIVAAGAPLFDVWRAPSESLGRTEFCARLGLHPERPYVLYLGSSSTVLEEEAWILTKLRAAMNGDAESAAAEIPILFWPHPAGGRISRDLRIAGVRVLQRSGTAQCEAEIQASLRHAAVVIGVNTRGLLDAVACDRPTIALQPDGACGLPGVHGLDAMIEAGAVYRDATAAKAALRSIGLLRKDPSAQARRRFAAAAFWPAGKPAGEAQAEAMLSLVSAKSGKPVELKRRPAPAPAESVAAPSVASEIHAIRASSRERRESLATSPLYAFYTDLRDRLAARVDVDAAAQAPDLWNASPVLVERWREHGHRFGAERRLAQGAQAERDAWLGRLDELRACDRSNLFVPEPAAAGGFGWLTDHGLINADAVQLYEMLIGLDEGGLLEPFKCALKERRAIVELGGGWGGLALRFRRLFPNATVFAVDHAEALLFTAVYLRATAPDARILLWEGGAAPLADWRTYDLVLAPVEDLAGFAPPRVDLAIDRVVDVSEAWVDMLERTGCPPLHVARLPYGPAAARLARLYDLTSLNRPADALAGRAIETLTAGHAAGATRAAAGGYNARS